MPDPSRLAQQSIRLLVRMGFTYPEACAGVLAACDSAAHRYLAAGEPVPSWLQQIAVVAALQKDRQLPQ